MQNLKKLRALLEFTDSKLLNAGITSHNGREKVALCLLDLTHYHAIGLSVLLEKNILPPAFALARIELESLVRGIWLRDCATEKEVQIFTQKDVILNESHKKINFKDLAKAIETHHKRPNTLSSYLDNSWNTLNSFTHNGLAQIYDHWGSKSLEPKFTEEQIDQIIHLTGRCDCLAFSGLLGASDRSDKDETIEKLQELTTGWLK